MSMTCMQGLSQPALAVPMGKAERRGGHIARASTSHKRSMPYKECIARRAMALPLGQAVEDDAIRAGSLSDARVRDPPVVAEEEAGAQY